MKKLIQHIKKHHEKLKNLDHKILEFIHGMELSLVLVASIVGITSAFIFYITDIPQATLEAPEEATLEVLVETDQGNKLQELAATPEGRELLFRIIETEEWREWVKAILESELWNWRDRSTESELGNWRVNNS